MSGFRTRLQKVVQDKAPNRSMSAWEHSVVEREGSIRALSSAPERFEIIENMLKSKVVGPRSKVKTLVRGLPIFPRIIKDIQLSFTSLDKNPSHFRKTITPEFLNAFETNARSLGIGAIGYTKLPREAIFKGKAVMFDHVITLTMEMDYDKMAMAPSHPTYVMIMETYYRLGHIINSLVTKLRKNGYGAQAVHPLNGVGLYPLIAQKAGLGWYGRHGLLITP